MFDFSWSELLLIGIVALIFIGPKELPGVLRTLGQWMSKIRRMAGDFQNQFHDAMREAELADLKKEVDEMASQAASYSSLDPFADVRKDLENAQREVESAVAGTPAEKSVAGTSAEKSVAAAEPALALPPTSDPVTAAAVSHSAPIAESVLPAPASPRAVAAGEAVHEPVDEAVKEPVTKSVAGTEPA